jgi:Cu+-exporting ATPase
MSLIEPGKNRPESHAKDPVCGMSVDPATSKYRVQAAGTTHFFCSSTCREKFIAEPVRYLKPEARKPAPAGTIYTCPMHPQIRQVGPGACPICGMTLEPVTVTGDEGRAPN